MNSTASGWTYHPIIPEGPMPLKPHDNSQGRLTLAAEPGVRGETLAAAFRHASHLHAGRIAVSLAEEQMTYGALRTRAECVARGLAERGLGPGALVGICVERSLEMVVAMLGVTLAGAAYLPLDAAYPAARLREMLEDADAVLMDRAGASMWQDAGVRCVLLEDLSAEGSAALHEPSIEPDDLAYVIYTSGSTGKPKGVMVTHANVVRLFRATEGRFHFAPEDVWTMFHSFAFDFSVWELWGALLTGGRVVIVPHAVSRSPEEFYGLLSREGVTVLNQTPSAFQLLMQVEQRMGVLPLKLRTVIFGGEALNLPALRPWIARHGDAQPELINMYGITETTVHVTCRRILARDSAGETQSLLGEPIEDLRLHLLDHALRPVKMGEAGEICVGGAGVARGYLRRPELTASRFIEDPWGAPGDKLYRSGDLAMRRADGELVYLGRTDRQVKIAGFRIELGEVEAAVSAQPGVAQVCVKAECAEAGGQRLIAYYSGAAEANALRSAVAGRLPLHMQPALYVRLKELPLNANGKLDREALRLPENAPEGVAEEGLGSTTAQRVQAIWCTTLSVPAVGMEENFFDCGGTSLLLIALRTRLEAEFSRSIPMTWMFEHTTVRTLAATLDQPVAKTAPNKAQAEDRGQRQRDSFARMRQLRSAAR